MDNILQYVGLLVNRNALPELTSLCPVCNAIFTNS